MTRKRALACAVAVAAAVGLVGCADGGEPPQRSEKSEKSEQSEKSEKSGTEASQERSGEKRSSPRAGDPPDDSRDASPSPSPSPTVVRAADGTDLEACRDADCEVKVRTGDVLRPTESDLPLDVITVDELGRDRVTLSMKGSSGGGLRLEGLNVSVSGECVNGDCEDTGQMTITRELTGRIDGVRVRLLQVADGHAILSFGS